MTEYAAITSMDKKYWDKAGKAMLQSYKKHCSESFPLYCYNEDGFNIKIKTVTPMGWDLGPAYAHFISTTSNSRVRNFGKKAFSIINAMNNVDADRLIWFDADTVINMKIPKHFLELISPDDVLSTHFGVNHEKEGTRYFSCETGFFILNMNHPKFKDFRDLYTKIYLEQRTEGLRRFYDGEVYGKVVQELELKGAKMMELNPGQRHKTPIPRSVIAPYVSHFKAGLKNRVDYDSMMDDEDDDDYEV
jgi:hypothetical protein